MCYRIIIASTLLLLGACERGDATPELSREGRNATSDAEATRRAANGGLALDVGARERIATDTITLADSALLAEGRRVVSTICVACHSEQPPAKLAPPLAHISGRYRMVLGSRDSAIARISAWIATPVRERSLMPIAAIDRFGLMAPLPLPEAQRHAAAAYVWSLSERGAGTMAPVPRTATRPPAPAL